MDTQTTTPPAGDSAQPASDTSALSLDDAVALLGPDKKEPAQPAQEQQGDAASDVPEEEPAEEAEPAAGEAEEPDAEASEPEPETEPEPEYAHGNLKVRLRDGTETTVGDLKKGREKVQELERQVAETEARVRKEIEPHLTQAQQKQKVLDELLPLAVEAVQSQLPPEPDSDLWDSDPIEAIQQQRRHDAAKARFQQLRQVQETQAAEQKKATDEAFQAYGKQQYEKLLSFNPELKDPVKGDAFAQEFHGVVKAWGFAPDEVNPHGLDARLIHNAVLDHRDAKKWRELKTAKPVVAEKQKDAAPVAAPSRRATPNERQNAAAEDLSKKLSKTGSLDDAVALLNIINR